MSIVGEYRRERRLLEIPNFYREDLGTFVRYSPLRKDALGIVCFTTLPEDGLASAIHAQIAHFEALSTPFEWKVYGSDRPERLRKALIDAGFEQGEPESLMVFETPTFRPAAKYGPDGIQIRRIGDVGTAAQIAEFQERVWGKPLVWLADQLRSTWNGCSFFLAYDNELLIGTGWIEYPLGSQFAELHGGTVLPDYRGRGIYSRLYEARMLDALETGVRWVAVDAAPMSRPILESKGFTELDTTYPMTWTPGQSGGD